MPMVPINGVAQLGIIQEVDVPPTELPLNAWSNGHNVRFTPGEVARVRGWKYVFDTLPIAPYWAIDAKTSSGVRLWLYAGLEKAYVTDSITSSDVTRLSGDYTTTEEYNFTGGSLGGVPFFNNQVDIPQYWPSINTGVELEDIPAWNSGWRCKVLRSYKQYLVALGITKGSASYPHMVKWSHPADPGSPPTSWDETDPTVDAGENNLLETPDELVDLVTLRDEALIYKQHSVWSMQWIGGIPVFRFRKRFDAFGMLVPNCAVEFFSGQHFVFTGSDAIVHDGQQFRSILEGRWRIWLEQNLNTAMLSRVFVQVNPARKEVWICFPSGSSELADKVLAWSWETNTCSSYDLPATRYIALGNVEQVEAIDTWEDDTGEWEDDESVWDDSELRAERNLLAVCPGEPQFILLDTTETQNGVLFSAVVERVGLGIPLRAEAPPDMQSVKFVTEIWPRITGPVGERVDVTVGYQFSSAAPVTWLAPIPFTIGVDEKVNVLFSGRLLAIRFSTLGAFPWGLAGLEWHVKRGGSY